MANQHEVVLAGLQNAGYEAFLVGGCVRDILLQRTPKDFDITTNALPEQVAAIFPNTIPVGAKFGVTVVVVDQVQIEVATYRADGAYTDGRRPDTVEYGKTAKDDVERRDFTMNGLLIGDVETTDENGEDLDYVHIWNNGNGGNTYTVVDHVGGFRDIRKKIIRCIGDPNKRFEEDALRMIRAVRFAAQLDFEIEVRTLEAIETNAHLLKNISSERVAAELYKMFSAPFPVKGLVPFIGTGLFRYCLPSEFSYSANVLRMIQRFSKFSSNHDRMLGMGMFFADVASHADLRLAKHLKLSNEETEEFVYMNSLVLSFGQHLKGSYEMAEANIKRYCRQPGLEVALEIMVQDEVIGKTNYGMEAVMAFVLKIKALKPEDIKPTPLVTGKDLLADGIPAGPIFSSILFDVETAQLNGLMTTRDQAMAFVRARVYQDDRKEWVYDPLHAPGIEGAI